MKKKSVVFSTIGGVIGGIIGGLLYPFIEHWHPLLFWGSVLCLFMLCVVLSVKFDEDRESFSEFKARKMRERELKKRHQQEENENA